MRTALFLVVLSLLSLLSAPRSGLAKAQEEQVDIVEPGETTSWGYSPTSATVPVGTTVVWTNTGSVVHSVTSQDQFFDSKLLDPGKSWSYTFETPGTYRYFCVPRPWMKGTVIVTSGEEPPPRPAATP